MGRFIAFLGAGILILVGLVFIFDLDTKLFTAKTSSDKEIDNTSSELINVGGITLGVKNEIDSVNLSFCGIDGIAYSDTTDYGNCYQITFIPIDERIICDEMFQKSLENKYDIVFSDADSVGYLPDLIPNSSGTILKIIRVRSLEASKDHLDFVIHCGSKEGGISSCLFISDNRLDKPIPKFTDTPKGNPKPDTSKISLKGITLGEKNNKTKLQTTVGGISGIVSVRTLKDGTAFSIVFEPTDLSGEWKSITEDQLRELELGLKTNMKLNC